MRAVIIDDEKRGRAALKNFIQKYCQQVEVIGEAENVLGGTDLIQQEQPELVFLDVRMPDGTGFDLLEQLTEINFELIFVTAYDEYAVEAFKFSAIDYLLKPVDPLRLMEAVKKAETDLEKRQINEKLETLLANRSGIEKIVLPSSDGIQLVRIKEILRCESDKNYTTFFLENKQKVIVARTLKEYDAMLSPHGFYRIHHSHLINLAYVSRYVKGEGGYVIMEDGTEVEVARRRKEGFLEALTSM